MVAGIVRNQPEGVATRTGMRPAGLDGLVTVFERKLRGKDEVGNEGVGLDRWVDGGARKLPGQYPAGDPKAFDPHGTIFEYTEPSAQNRPPNDKHRHF